VRFTKLEGDGRRFAQEAVEAGVDLVAVYGGDGTVAEVAGGLVGTRMPLGILPGGTANVMSVELGIPGHFADALALMCRPDPALRAVDVGQVGNHTFMLRLSMGLEAKMVAGTDRLMKDRLGTLAYAFSALRAIAAPEVATYEFELDGEQIEAEGIACIVANSANLGTPGLRLASDVDVSDGVLDVFVVKNADFSTWLTVIGSLLSSFPDQLGAEPLSGDPVDIEQLERGVRHWQARDIHIKTSPSIEVQCDGDMIGETPIDVKIIPGAVHVIVPREESA
jgi:diacylglycerol kinase (ATP)